MIAPTITDLAQMHRRLIAFTCESYGYSPCEVEAEILAQSLMSDDCDDCHVHWLEFHAALECKLITGKCYGVD